MVSLGRMSPNSGAYDLTEAGFYGQGADGYGAYLGYNSKNGFTFGYFTQNADEHFIAASNSISWSAHTVGPTLSSSAGIGVTSGTRAIITGAFLVNNDGTYTVQLGTGKTDRFEFGVYGNLAARTPLSQLPTVGDVNSTYGTVYSFDRGIGQQISPPGTIGPSELTAASLASGGAFDASRWGTPSASIGVQDPIDLDLALHPLTPDQTASLPYNKPTYTQVHPVPPTPMTPIDNSTWNLGFAPSVVEAPVAPTPLSPPTMSYEPFYGGLLSDLGLEAPPTPFTSPTMDFEPFNGGLLGDLGYDGTPRGGYARDDWGQDAPSEHTGVGPGGGAYGGTGNGGSYARNDWGQDAPSEHTGVGPGGGAYGGTGDGGSYARNDWGQDAPSEHNGVGPGGDDDEPVLLDLSGNGLNLNTLGASSQFVNVNGDGYQHRMAWAGNGTGVLVFDADGDGKISNSKEFEFTQWDPTATGDLEALKDVFDTNGNGKLDAGDAQWSKFKVMVNGQLVSLDSLGITSIDLTPKGSGQSFSDGSAITGTTTYGSVGLTSLW